MNDTAGCSSDDSSRDWQVAHERLGRLARARAGLDEEEGRWLLLASRQRVHARLGFGSFGEYVGRLFGYGARLVQEKLRVAEALEGLPVMAHALRAGQICWSAVRELTRVATAETEQDWRAAAQGKTVREVEKLVAGLGPGSRPADERNPGIARHVLRFEVTGEVLATVREALAKLQRDAGEALDDDAALLLMARAVLQGPSDEGRSSYQLALTVCERCQCAKQHGQGELIEVGPEVLEMASCDARHVGRVDGAHVGARPSRAVQDIPPAVRRLVLRRDQGRCRVPGCRHATWVDVHHVVSRGEGGGHEPENLVTLCGAHHRALHLGTLVAERSDAGALLFRHADGKGYGQALDAAAAEAGAKTFQALRGLGFKESEVRWALAQTTDVGAEASVEARVRHCLLLLTERLARAS
jgi:5-methylcytosine-specific restriction endonuclease McrA